MNRVRSFFRGSKVAPAPAVQETRKERRLNIKNESFSDALKRDYVFFYYKLKGLEPPREKRFVTPQQEEEVRRVLLDADARGMSANQIALEYFGKDLTSFDEELMAWEQYKPNIYLNKGTPYERRAFPLARSLARFIPTIKGSKQNIRYQSDLMVHQCEVPEPDKFVETLSDDYCVSIIIPTNRETFEQQKGITFPVSYILVKPEFFPSGNTSDTPATIGAKRLPTVSFVLDAFRQKGVLEIEPTLKRTLEREAPELLQFSSKNPVVLATPWYLTDPSVTSGSFIIVDSLQRGRNVLNQKELSKSEVLRDVFSKKKVYFMDPKTMFYIRESLYPLWLANYGAINTSLYRRLTQNEKLVFCFLQFTKFLELYSLFRDAQPGNNGSISSRKIVRALQKAKALVFEADYSAGANPYELAENFTVEDNENWKQLIQIQKDVLGNVTVQNEKDLRTLLSKFTLRKNAIAETVIPDYYGVGTTTANIGTNVGRLAAATATRKQRVKQMLDYQNIQTKRATLMKQFKNALSKPVKTSVLPNFMRTKKAKERNRQAYINRIETARKAVLKFNQEHGQNYYV